MKVPKPFQCTSESPGFTSTETRRANNSLVDHYLDRHASFMLVQNSVSKPPKCLVGFVDAGLYLSVKWPVTLEGASQIFKALDNRKRGAIYGNGWSCRLGVRCRLNEHLSLAQADGHSKELRGFREAASSLRAMREQSSPNRGDVVISLIMGQKLSTYMVINFGEKYYTVRLFLL